MTKFVQCEQCHVKVDEACAFAQHTRIVDGKRLVFCCEKCAEKHRESKA